MGHRIGIGDLEAPFLEVITVIKFRAADEECALWVDHDVHSLGRNKDVARLGAVNQVHLVLEAGATATDDGHTESPIGTSLFGEQ